MLTRRRDSRSSLTAFASCPLQKRRCNGGGNEGRLDELLSAIEMWAASPLRSAYILARMHLNLHGYILAGMLPSGLHDCIFKRLTVAAMMPCRPCCNVIVRKADADHALLQGCGWIACQAVQGRSRRVRAGGSNGRRRM